VTQASKVRHAGLHLCVRRRLGHGPGMFRREDAARGRFRLLIRMQVVTAKPAGNRNLCAEGPRVFLGRFPVLVRQH
jgi:hypothetical protein